jgi:hypothetical protein
LKIDYEIWNFRDGTVEKRSREIDENEILEMNPLMRKLMKDGDRNRPPAKGKAMAH